MKKHLLACALLAAFVTFASEAHATPLVPGTFGIVPEVCVAGVNCSDPAGSFIDTIEDLPFDAGVYSGFYTAAVYQNPDQTLDFYFQISNDADSDDALSRLQNSAYNDFLTDVAQTSDGDGAGSIFSAGTELATTSSRSADGDTVRFNFDGEIEPGATSYTVIIRTNATLYSRTGNSIVVNGVSTNITTFEPVPEPGTLALLGSGLVGVAGAARRRYRNRTTA